MCMLRSNAETIENLDGIKKCLSHEVYQSLFSLIQLALTIPVSSVSCERTFSAMRRIKSRLITLTGSIH